jgi:hypothetical protein
VARDIRRFPPRDEVSRRREALAEVEVMSWTRLLDALRPPEQQFIIAMIMFFEEHRDDDFLELCRMMIAERLQKKGGT